MDDVARSRLGRTLRGKYQLDSVLGVGGMAAVYAATHRNRKQFAIKMLHPDLSNSEQIRTRFLREGYVANSVNHSGAVAVLDDDVAEDGSAFLVMELLDGLSVEQLWERRGYSLSIPMVLALADQVLDVLAAAHRNGVVHRDVKPANMFVTRDGSVKVLDFGIASLRDANHGRATTTGSMLGTPAFMPPEQALGKSDELDAQTDLWAVGATLFTLISGQFVHEGSNSNQLVLNAATRPARSLQSVVLVVPASVARVVDRALSFDKKHRWLSASEMQRAVRDSQIEVFGRPVSARVLALSEIGPTELAGANQDVYPVAGEAAPGSSDRGSSPAAGQHAAAAVQPRAAAQASVGVEGGVEVQPAAAAFVEVNIASPPAAPAARFTWPAIALLAIALAGAAFVQWTAKEREGPVHPLRAAPESPPAAPSAIVQVQPVTPVSSTERPAVVPSPSPVGSNTRSRDASPRPNAADRSRATPHPATPVQEPTALSPVCTRLLERQSLGEALTADERSVFSQRCRR